jgi:hypothetical protein
VRVLFAGHAGLCKETVLENLKKEIIRVQYGATPGTKEYRNLESQVDISSPEDGIKKILGTESLVPFLEAESDQNRKRLWLEAMKETVERINKSNPETSLLHVHLALQRKSRFFSPSAWAEAIELIRQFKPELVITLIDDVYDVQTRIKTGSYLKLRELITWRAVEVLLADILARELYPESVKSARFPYEHSFVFAIKHPPQTLYKLLFQPETPKIYACIPISRTRDNSGKRGEIDAAIFQLEEHFTVFNPLTIDEKPLESLVNRRQNGTSSVEFAADDRWPVGQCCVGEKAVEYPITLDVTEIADITGVSQVGAKSDVQRNIEVRDYRLVEQAHCILCYRPRYGDTDVSKGMRQEVTYAANSRSVPASTVYVHNPEVDGAMDDPLGPEFSVNSVDLEGAIDRIWELFPKGKEEELQ